MVELTALLIGGVACATDLRSARIPNLLTFSAAATAVLFHLLAPQGSGVWFVFLGLAAGLLVFFPFFALGAMGAGDVKLMAALGAWIGWQPTVQVALYGAIAGGVLAIVVSMWHGYLRQALRNVFTLVGHWWLVGIKPLPELTLDAGKGLRLPYALPIMVGLVVTLWRA